MAYSPPATVVTATTITSAWGNSVKTAADYLANPPSTRVNHNTTQSITDSTLTKLAFNAERHKTVAGMHNTVTNNSRITITDAGLYVVGFTAGFAAAADYVRVYGDLFLNNTTIIDADDKATPAVSHGPLVRVTTMYKFAAADYIEARVYQDNTANAARNAVNTGNYTPEFWATWIGLG